MTFPVNDLKDRYNLSKQAELNRRKHLGITPKKENGVYVVTDSELALLDELNDFLKTSGAKLSDFTPQSSQVHQVKSSTPSQVKSSQLETVMEAQIVPARENNALDFFDSLEMLAAAITSKIDPAASDKALLWYAENSILIPTSKLRDLIGVKPSDELVRGSFKFRKIPRAFGVESGWKIERV